MGNSLRIKPTSQFVNFEFVLNVIKNHDENVIIINTLPVSLQHCLIQSTIDATTESEIINQLIENDKKDVCIIIYGKTHTDLTVHEKYSQLTQYGFSDIRIYLGGMFEWLLLQDIYGKEEFPTSGKDVLMDMLCYK